MKTFVLPVIVGTLVLAILWFLVLGFVAVVALAPEAFLVALEAVVALWFTFITGRAVIRLWLARKS